MSNIHLWMVIKALGCWVFGRMLTLSCGLFGYYHNLVCYPVWIIWLTKPTFLSLFGGNNPLEHAKFEKPSQLTLNEVNMFFMAWGN